MGIVKLGTPDYSKACFMPGSIKLNRSLRAISRRSLTFGVDLRYEAATNITGRNHPMATCFGYLSLP
jgi:hypothetical protein